MRRWKRTGLVPGARVRMVEANAEDGVFTLEISGRRVVAGREGLTGVMIERRSRGRA
jgi:Fe2+ transport system protein FeoA